MSDLDPYREATEELANWMIDLEERPPGRVFPEDLRDGVEEILRRYFPPPGEPVEEPEVYGHGPGPGMTNLGDPSGWSGEELQPQPVAWLVSPEARAGWCATTNHSVVDKAMKSPTGAVRPLYLYPAPQPEIRSLRRASRRFEMTIKRGPHPVAPPPEPGGEVDHAWLGISYPLPCWRPILWAWRRTMCGRGYHLFDEVASWGPERTEHYLFCDACDLEVHIREEARSGS